MESPISTNQKSDQINHLRMDVAQCIHSKSKQIGGGDLLLSAEKLAEKVRISGGQNFATNVHLS